MQMQFVGVGNSSTTKDYYQSSFILRHNGKSMLVDCGTDARFSLEEVGITSAEAGNAFDAVYITHVHGDHCGGLEWLAFCTYFNKNKTKLPKLIAHPSVLSDLEIMLNPSLNSLKGFKADLSTFFDVQPVDDWFKWNDVEFDLVKGEHVWSNDKYMPMYGLYIVTDKLENNGIFFSGDTKITSTNIDVMENAVLIFHDCCDREPKSSVHANYDELKQLEPHIRNKMWLYHYWHNPVQIPKNDGFLGWCSKGDIFDI